MRAFGLAVFVSAVLAIVGAFSRVSAWNDTGHMLAAEIAYRQVGLAERARAVQILKDAFQGPDSLERFEQDLTAGMPSGASPGERDHYIFLKAATWPDILRDGPHSDHPHPLHGEFHKGGWHFIDLPFAPPGDGVAPPPPVPTPPGMDPQDAISAIRLCIADVKAPGTSKRIRAARLCFLLHMVGDIHQPLHAAAMFSTDHLPGGDHGGNLQLVRLPGDAAEHDRVATLHSVWDGLFGYDTRLGTLRTLGDQILHGPTTRPDVLSSMLERKDPMQWAHESRDDAVQFAYLNGQLKTLRGMSLDGFRQQHQLKARDVPSLPNNYRADALPIAEKRVALAGCRLAEILMEALAPAP